MLEESAKREKYTCLNTHQVGRHYRVEGFRVKHHPARHGVDEHLVALDIWKVLRNFSSDLIPHNHSVSLRVTFGNDCYLLSWSALGCFEGESYQAFNTMAGKDGHLRSGLPLLTSMRSASLSSIFTFGIFADNYPI